MTSEEISECFKQWMPYEKWRALDSDEAAEWLAQKAGWDSEQERKLKIILRGNWENRERVYNPLPK